MPALGDPNKVLRMLESAPIPQMIQSYGIAVAEAQKEMDRLGAESVVALADEENGIEMPNGGGTKTLLELGFTPTFYHFQEVRILAKVAFSFMQSEAISAGFSLSIGVPLPVPIPLGFGVSVNASYSNKFSFQADGSSEIDAKLISVPPPSGLADFIREQTAKPD